MGFDPASRDSKSDYALYEDAEDRSVSRWTIYHNPTDASVTNVYDEDRRSQVIEFSCRGTASGFNFILEADSG